MLELLLITLFLFSLWTIGQSALLFAKRYDLHWLSFPLGLCIVTIAHNFLYFGLDCSVQFIQKVLLALTILGVLYLIYKQVFAKELHVFFGIFLIFLFLSLPALLGGEQYYVFRGNQWDHFCYLDGAIAFWSGSFSFFSKIHEDWYVGKEVIKDGIDLFFGGDFPKKVPIIARPAVSQVFAGTLLKSGIGNIHLLAFLYVTALWSTFYSSVRFGWQEILIHAKKSEAKFWVKELPVFAIVCGFWGQYIFDINSWSQMAAAGPLFGMTLLFIKWISNESSEKIKKLFPTYILTAILFSGAFLLYIEETALFICILGMSTLSWLLFNKRLFSSRLIVSIHLMFGIGLLLTSPTLLEILRFGYSQIHNGFSSFGWWRFFDSYWRLHESTNVFLNILTFVPSLFGLYFITPDCNRHAFLYVTQCVPIAVFVATMLYWLGSLFKKQSLKHQGINVHLQMFCICCFVPIAILAFKEQWWAFGKYLSYVMPYFLLLLFVSLLTDDDWKISITLKKLFFILAGIVLAGNTFFAFTRLISAFDKNGIGHDPTTYPSANGSIKLMNKFNLDISNLDKKKVVNIIVDDDFLHNYVKQKLTYADVPYYHSEPKKTYFGGNDSYYPSIPKPDNMCQRIILEKNSMGINEFKTHNCEESVRLDYPKEKKLK